MESIKFELKDTVLRQSIDDPLVADHVPVSRTLWYNGDDSILSDHPEQPCCGMYNGRIYAINKVSFKHMLKRAQAHDPMDIFDFLDTQYEPHPPIMHGLPMQGINVYFRMTRAINEFRQTRDVSRSNSDKTRLCFFDTVFLLEFVDAEEELKTEFTDPGYKIDKPWFYGKRIKMTTVATRETVLFKSGNTMLYSVGRSFVEKDVALSRLNKMGLSGPVDPDVFGEYLHNISKQRNNMALPEVLQYFGEAVFESAIDTLKRKYNADEAEIRWLAGYVVDPDLRRLTLAEVCEKYSISEEFLAACFEFLRVAVPPTAAWPTVRDLLEDAAVPDVTTTLKVLTYKTKHVVNSDERLSLEWMCCYPGYLLRLVNDTKRYGFTPGKLIEYILNQKVYRGYDAKVSIEKLQRYFELADQCHEKMVDFPDMDIEMSMRDMMKKLLVLDGQELYEELLGQIPDDIRDHLMCYSKAPKLTNVVHKLRNMGVCVCDDLHDLLVRDEIPLFTREIENGTTLTAVHVHTHAAVAVNYGNMTWRLLTGDKEEAEKCCKAFGFTELTQN